MLFIFIIPILLFCYCNMEWINCTALNWIQPVYGSENWTNWAILKNTTHFLFILKSVFIFEVLLWRIIIFHTTAESLKLSLWINWFRESGANVSTNWLCCTYSFLTYCNKLCTWINHKGKRPCEFIQGERNTCPLRPHPPRIIILINK